MFVHSLKIDWLRELVESLDGEPLLIAYEFIEDLRTIRRAFGEVPALGGSTPAGAKQLVAAWNAGALPLLALHPASAGHGLNLQHGGSRMAWLSPSWSAELTEQAIARIYRPGQQRHVTIHVCVAAGTIDEMKRDRVHGKRSAQEAFRRHLERSLMHPRTAFRLAMLANGYWPLLNDCKRVIEPGWPRRIVDAAEVLAWDRSALTSTGLKLDGDLAVIDVDVDEAGLVAALAGALDSAPPRCSRTAWSGTPAAPGKPGSRASRSRSGGSPRGAGIAAAIQTIRRCLRISWSASARSGRGNSRSTGRMPATIGAR